MQPFASFRNRASWSPEWEAQFRNSAAQQLAHICPLFLIGTMLFQLFNLSYTLYYTDFRLYTSPSRVYTVLYVILFLASLLGLLGLRYEVRRERSDRILLMQYLYAAVALLWGISVTAYDQRVSNQIYVYTLVILAIALLTYMPPKFSLPFFLCGQLLFMAALPVFQPADVDNHSGFVNSAAFCFIALLISYCRYNNARRSFEHQQIIQEKTQELVAKSEELDYVANHDPLTGLWNRRYLDLYLEQLIRTCQQQPETGIGVFMIDVDNFKDYNDAFGHVMGDTCLKRAAQAMEQCCASVRFFRYGGEEFLYVAPADRPEALYQLGERVRQAVEDLQIPAAEAGHVVTISVGCSYAPVRQESDWDRLLQAADQALYRAKAAGKNKVDDPLAVSSRA